MRRRMWRKFFAGLFQLVLAALEGGFLLGVPAVAAVAGYHLVLEYGPLGWVAVGAMAGALVGVGVQLWAWFKG